MCLAQSQTPDNLDANHSNRLSLTPQMEIGFTFCIGPHGLALLPCQFVPGVDLYDGPSVSLLDSKPQEDGFCMASLQPEVWMPATR